MKNVYSILTFIVHACFFQDFFSLEQWYFHWNQGTIYYAHQNDARFIWYIPRCNISNTIVNIQDIGLPRSSVSMVTANRIPLSAFFFKEEIGLASPISLKMRERPTPNSDLDWPKENTQTLLLSRVYPLW